MRSERAVAYSVSRRMWLAGSVALGIGLAPAHAVNVSAADRRRYFDGVAQSIAALAASGAMLSADDVRTLQRLAANPTDASIAAAEAILERYTLFRVTLDESGVARTSAGGARAELIEQGWRAFLVRVENAHGARQPLSVATPHGAPTQMYVQSGAQRPALLDTVMLAPMVAERWLAADMAEMPELDGGPVSYRVIRIFARDRGQRESNFAFALGDADEAGSALFYYPERRYRAAFQCMPSRDVMLAVRDADGQGCVASFVVTDALGRVYPHMPMRLAPDMAFHQQIYRGDGESVRLPDGEYSVTSWRGPEYVRSQQTVRIDEERAHIDVQLERWVDPARHGWYSGDTHLHAFGCLHYEHPTTGVSPETMIRQVRGEGLSIGQILNWGGGYYYQRQFFSGRAVSPAAELEHAELQAANNTSLRPRATARDGQSLIRYDVESSGFPSSHSGHLLMLGLRRQDFPGAEQIEDWPTWNLPILQWVRRQGGIAGFAHSGFGLATRADTLPSYDVPDFNSVGANELIVDVAHGFGDFLSGTSLPPKVELNAWYHLLNCGFTLPMLGDTDYPCLTGERVGVGRTYVHLDQRPTDERGYRSWLQNLQRGRLYFGDGRSHFLTFGIDGRGSGESVALTAPGEVDVRATIAARLEPEAPDAAARETLPAWHLERARVGDTRDVEVELVINGVAVETTRVIADGAEREIGFRPRLERSAWVALRILPSGHTHPVFVQVDERPVRASRRSAEWCRASVDRLWEEKARFIRETEREAAARAYAHARQVYERIAIECETD
jgi:hypothetical protein